MLTKYSYGRWKRSIKTIIAIILVFPLNLGLCKSETDYENQDSDEYKTLLNNIKVTTDGERRSDLCEKALASGKLLQEEIGMVYGLKASNYFGMAMEYYQHAKESTKLDRDVEMKIQYLIDASLQNYNSAIAVNPGLYLNYWNRGYIYELQGNLDKALQDYNTVVELEPGFVDGYLYRIRVLMEQGNEQLTLNDIESVLTIEPDNQTALKLKQKLTKTN